MIDDLTYHYDDADHQTVSDQLPLPDRREFFVLQYGIIVKKSRGTARRRGDADRDQPRRLHQDRLRAGRRDLAEQGPHRQPAACEEDGPVYQLRRWYEQFYVDVADVQPEMVDRFEFEIDTTRPHEAWMKDVEAEPRRGGSS